MIAHKQLAAIFFAPFAEIIWRDSAAGERIYLTFDDGPVPQVTGQILNILAKFSVPATFFLLGERIDQFQGQLAGEDYRGHALANHGYFHRPHILGSCRNWLEELKKTDELIGGNWQPPENLFRPPYGIFGPGLRKTLAAQKKKMILWSVMSNDFKWPRQKAFAFLKKNTRPGDIVVFHDSVQTAEITPFVLPEFIIWCRDKGWKFSPLTVEPKAEP
ncbi:MAG: polysaccharide deacetylase family protein [Calditrichia bacterium]